MENKTAIDVSVIMPCLNEEETVGICIEKCFKVFKSENINGEVIVVDNGSTDRSKGIILKTKARLVEEPRRGYGSAYLRGFSEAKGRFLIMADSDNTYDFLEIPNFLKPLKEGYDFVIGTRLRGNIEEGEGTMPWLHKYVGNPLLTGFLKMLFKIKMSDVYCGMRAMTKEAYAKLNLRSTGMEFALEMVVNTGRTNLKVMEIPINYGLRLGQSKLRTFQDGWRSLRFMLLFAPNFLFIWPGAVFFAIGTILMLMQIKGPFSWGGIYMDIHFMILGLTLSLLGISIFQMGIIIKKFSHLRDYYINDPIVKWLKNTTLEKQLLFGCSFVLVGLAVDLIILDQWIAMGFHNIFVPRLAIFGLFFIFLGISFILFAFLQAAMYKE
jgi:glycosyltransferase involved in cell wall biosynthesis